MSNTFFRQPTAVVKSNIHSVLPYCSIPYGAVLPGYMLSWQRASNYATPGMQAGLLGSVSHVSVHNRFVDWDMTEYKFERRATDPTNHFVTMVAKIVQAS